MQVRGLESNFSYYQCQSKLASEILRFFLTVMMVVAIMTLESFSVSS